MGDRKVKQSMVWRSIGQNVPVFQKVHEDTWSNQQVHTNFPQNAVRVVGQPNSYVALWYRNGKPVMGKAWNDSGVVQVSHAKKHSKPDLSKKIPLASTYQIISFNSPCAFAADHKAFIGAEVSGKTIQLLIYKGTHVQNQFYYDWITLSAWKSSNNEMSTRQLVRCGSAAPIFWKEKSLLGNYDIDAQKASFVETDKFCE
ncbi:hypothetical protein OSTOST_20043, partial [Ostertagia ostertagi]